jgi:hypothetical protein
VPGPVECRAFAMAVIGLPAQTPASLLSQRPDLARRAEELTHTCLTEPWDYELLGCLTSGGSQYACMTSFKQRRLTGSSGSLPARY